MEGREGLSRNLGELLTLKLYLQDINAHNLNPSGNKTMIIIPTNIYEKLVIPGDGPQGRAPALHVGVPLQSPALPSSPSTSGEYSWSTMPRGTLPGVPPQIKRK